MNDKKIKNRAEWQIEALQSSIEEMELEIKSNKDFMRIALLKGKIHNRQECIKTIKSKMKDV